MADEYISGYAPYFFCLKGKEERQMTLEDIMDYDYTEEEAWEILVNM